MSSIKKINNKFSKGINNIFSPTLLNLFILLSLMIILSLVYLKFKKFELFDCSDPTDTINYPCSTQAPTTTQSPTTTQPQNGLIPEINNGYIQSMISSYMNNLQNKKYYQSKLNVQQSTIQTLAQQINNTLNRY